VPAQYLARTLRGDPDIGVGIGVPRPTPPRSDAILRSDPASAVLGPNPGAELIHHGSQAITGAPPALSALVEAALTQGFQAMFLAGAVIAGLAFLAALFVKELPLRSTL